MKDGRGLMCCAKGRRRGVKVEARENPFAVLYPLNVKPRRLYRRHET